MRWLKVYLYCLIGSLLLFVVLELSLFIPKSQAVSGAEYIEERQGGLIAVDLDTRVVTEYRRGLLLERYFPQEQLEMKTQDSVTSSCQNWYTTCVYQVDTQGNIQIQMEKRAWGWLWAPCVCSIILLLIVRVYQLCAARRKSK